MSEVSENNEVVVEGDTIFFFCDVDDDTVRDLCTALKKLSMKYDTIKIAIQSSGGDLYAALAAMDFIRTLNRRVETTVYGFCASAATFIFLGGTVRRMGRNAWILIHQMSTECGGTYQDLRADMKTNKKLMKQFKVKTQSGDVLSYIGLDIRKQPNGDRIVSQGGVSQEHTGPL